MQVKIRPMREARQQRPATARTPRAAASRPQTGRVGAARRQRDGAPWQRDGDLDGHSDRDWQLEEVDLDEGLFLHDAATGRLYEELDDGWVRPCGTLGKDGLPEWDEREHAIDRDFYEHLDAFLQDEDIDLQDLFDQMDADGAPARLGFALAFAAFASFFTLLFALCPRTRPSNRFAARRSGWALILYRSYHVRPCPLLFA